MKNLLVVSHCILNNAAKVEQDEAELAEEVRGEPSQTAFRRSAPPKGGVFVEKGTL